MWMMVNDDKLYQTPPRLWKRILDIGTGTGIWSIDVGVYSPRGGVSELLIMGSADEHEEAEVLGVDLSPIQPNWYAFP